MIITSPTGFNIALTNVDDWIQFSFKYVDATLKRGCVNVVPTLCNVVSTSDFVSFSTSDQRYLKFDPQR